MKERSYTAPEVARIEEYAIEELKIDVLQLMEVAGFRSAEVMRDHVQSSANITVLAGSGGNGGDALVCAKWLHLWGYHPIVILASGRSHLKPVTRHQLSVWEHLGGDVTLTPPRKTNAIVDGLIGFSLEGAPRGKAAELIEWTNSQKTFVLSLDIPSGLDASTGKISTPCVRATRTVVFSLMKQGLLSKEALPYIGIVKMVDIGLPKTFPKDLLDPVQ